MLCLTGLKEEAIAKLERRGSVILEFLSYTNVRTIALMEPGERVFVTKDLYEEVGKGSEGIVAEVETKSIAPVRVSMDHLDEREVQRARVKLRFVSYGRVKGITVLNGLPSVELIILDQQVIL